MADPTTLREEHQVADGQSALGRFDGGAHTRHLTRGAG